MIDICRWKHGNIEKVNILKACDVKCKIESLRRQNKTIYVKNKQI